MAAGMLAAAVLVGGASMAQAIRLVPDMPLVDVPSFGVGQAPMLQPEVTRLAPRAGVAAFGINQAPYITQAANLWGVRNSPASLDFVGGAPQGAEPLSITDMMYGQDVQALIDEASGTEPQYLGKAYGQVGNLQGLDSTIVQANSGVEVDSELKALSDDLKRTSATILESNAKPADKAHGVQQLRDKLAKFSNMLEESEAKARIKANVERKVKMVDEISQMIVGDMSNNLEDLERDLEKLEREVDVQKLEAEVTGKYHSMADIDEAFTHMDQLDRFILNQAAKAEMHPETTEAADYVEIAQALHATIDRLVADVIATGPSPEKEQVGAAWKSRQMENVLSAIQVLGSAARQVLPAMEGR